MPPRRSYQPARSKALLLVLGVLAVVYVQWNGWSHVLFYPRHSAPPLLLPQPPSPPPIACSSDLDAIRNPHIRRVVELGREAMRDPAVLLSRISKRLQAPKENTTRDKPKPEPWPRDAILNPLLLKMRASVDNEPEKYFADVLLPRAPRRALVIDVGANTGQFAKSVAAAGLDGLSFEPSPENCAVLKNNLAAAKQRSWDQGLAFGHVQVHCAAVGAATGNVSLGVKKSAASDGGPQRTSASFRIAVPGGGGGTAAAAAAESEDKVMVPIVPLDAVVPADRPILLLKTDTQGFEEGVLRGARRLLESRAVAFLIVECSPYLIEHNGGTTTPITLMRLIASFGYACTHLAFFQPYDVPRITRPDRYIEFDVIGTAPPRTRTGRLIENDRLERVLRPILQRTHAWWSEGAAISRRDAAARDGGGGGGASADEDAVIGLTRTQWEATQIEELRDTDYILVGNADGEGVGAYVRLSRRCKTVAREPLDGAAATGQVLPRRRVFGNGCNTVRSFRRGPLAFPAAPDPASPQCPNREADTLSFTALYERLKRVPPTGRSGWTDLLCFPADGGGV